MGLPAITNGYALGSRTNQGGIKAIYVGLWNDTAATFTLGTGPTANEIISVAGATVSYYSVAQRIGQGMATFALVASTPNGTTYFTQTVECVIEALDNLKSNWINTLVGGIWRVIVLDMTGNYWLYGMTTGMYVNSAPGGPNKGYGDGNKATLTFSGEEPLTPMLIQTNTAISMIVGP